MIREGVGVILPPLLLCTLDLLSAAIDKCDRNDGADSSAVIVLYGEGLRQKGVTVNAHKNLLLYQIESYTLDVNATRMSCLT